MIPLLMSGTTPIMPGGPCDTARTCEQEAGWNGALEWAGEQIESAGCVCSDEWLRWVAKHKVYSEVHENHCPISLVAKIREGLSS